jgi:hypothetical protein
LTAANATADKWTANSYLNSTAGRININTAIYPNNAFFQAPSRKLVIKALFKNLLTDSDLDALANNWDTYQATKGFDDVGRAVEVPGFLGPTSVGTAGTDSNKEGLLRLMASCMTTQSNTFGIWGIGQSVRKKPGNTNYGTFEPGDLVKGEKRFYALIERGVWPGLDSSPGNAGVDASGAYNNLASPPISGADNSLLALASLPDSAPNTGVPVPKWAALDGKTSGTSFVGTIPFKSSPLNEANNPADPLMRFRPVFFRFLDQ